jgi:hypothetical protein
VLGWLHNNRRPVAVSMLVFKDPVGGRDNWSTLVGRSFGEVLDPPPTSVVSSGHAVCIVGFRPDPTERLGGFFLFRNSWGPHWGRQAQPEPGYGFLSAGQLEDYCIEACQTS